jgi:5S rRNA maturation endonuclease (ribonuclease M5)
LSDTERFNVDIRAELEEFPWIRARWTSNKLIAVSPFRYNDNHPSFFVDLDTGGWHDSGASDVEWTSGSIVKLLAFLRQETQTEAYEYLRSTYAKDESQGAEVVTLSIPKLYVPDKSAYKPLDSAILDEYQFRSPYLGQRGISEAVQRLAHIGFDRTRQAVTIPWYNADGTLGNVKYRRIAEKTFWYAKGGRRLSEMVYGINIVYQRRVKRAVIVEAEIDALTVMSAGVCGIAVGGTAFTAAKRDLIARSPLEEILILRDNDAPGRLLQRKLITELSPYMTVKIAVIPKRYGKDANDCGLETLKACIERARTVRRLAYVLSVS